jgi:hypothetical protein
MTDRSAVSGPPGSEPLFEREKREVPPVDEPLLPTVADLVRIATDVEPDSGDYGPELVLGSWGAYASLPARRAAVAWCAWTSPVGIEPTPLERASRDRSLPTRLRAALHALSRTPTGVFRLSPGPTPESWYALDLIGLGASAPREAVEAPDPVALAVPDHAGPVWVLGRAARSVHGWSLVAPIAVPALPCRLPAAWSAAVRSARTADPQAQTAADVLRRAGHLLARMLADPPRSPP